MAKNPEVRSQLLEWYINFNKITFIGALGFAAVAAFVAPTLVVPALIVAGVDAAQFVIFDRINRKPQPQKNYIAYYKGISMLKEICSHLSLFLL